LQEFHFTTWCLSRSNRSSDITISVFTDEINRQSPARALELAREWQVDYVEVRSLVSGRFPNVDDHELEDIVRLITDSGVAVSAVSPGFCKGPVDDPGVATSISEGLPKACKWARRLGTELISCFAFSRTDDGLAPAAVTSRVREMAAIVEDHGCRLMLENEATSWAATGIEAVAIINETGADKVGLCWDPGNAARAGSAAPFPDEYELIKSHVAHVHVKNYNQDTGNWSLADVGAVDWKGQMAALKRDGYTGHVVVETHTDISPDTFSVVEQGLSSLERNTLHNLKFVRQLV
jgi:L-ribulose-5-phosphate 3-epimerase